MRTSRRLAALGSVAICALTLCASSPLALAQVPAPGQPGGIPSSLRPKPPSTFRPGTEPALNSPVDPKLDVRAAIEEAKKKAIAMRGRILVIWVADPSAPYPRSMMDVLNTADIHQRLGLEYAVVWAAIGSGDRAAANRELAKSLGAGVTATDVHPTFTILTQAGKPVATRSSIDMVDPVRTSTYTAPVVNDFFSEHAEPPPAAKTIADEAMAKAKETKRAVLLTFGQYGEEWSWKFRTWLAKPEVVAVLEKRAIVTDIELLRDKGAFELLEKMGGVHVQTLPWFVVLNADGKSVGTSQPEKMPNIGFPTDEAETTAFCALLKAGNPEWSDADTKAIRASLAAFLGRKAP